MLRELQLRRFAPATQRLYLEAVVNLTKPFGIAPDRLSARQVQDYLLYLMTERHLQWNRQQTGTSRDLYEQRCLDVPVIGYPQPLLVSSRHLTHFTARASMSAASATFSGGD